MNVDGPPRVATWLLVRLVSGPGRESLIGDLLERHQEKRSTAWFWHQVLAAIIATNASEIWNHRALALRVILLGWFATYVLDVAVGNLLSALLPSARFTFSSTRGSSLLPFLFNSAVLIGIGHTTLVRVCTGWLLARTHRSHQTPMVFAFLSSFLLLDLPWLCRRGIDAAASGHTPLVAAFVVQLVGLAVTVMGLTAGLVLARERPAQTC